MHSTLTDESLVQQSTYAKKIRDTSFSKYVFEIEEK